MDADKWHTLQYIFFLQLQSLLLSNHEIGKIMSVGTYHVILLYGPIAQLL